MDVLRVRRDVLRATISGTMTVLDALLRSQAATALERQSVLDLILHDQVSLHILDAQVQENLKDEEFDADVLDAIDFDERICALRTRVRFSASQDSPESPVPQLGAALFSTGIATSTLCPLPEEARPTVSTRVTGDVPPVREMTGALVVEQANDDGGAAALQDAKQDTEGLSQGERIQRPPNPGVSVIAVTEQSQGPCRDLAVADTTIGPETSDRPCHDLEFTDATPALEVSLRPCCDRFVGDAALASATFQQPCYDSQTVLLDPATKTQIVEKGITKRLVLRRYVREVRLQRRAEAALILFRWRRIRAVRRNGYSDGGDPFSGEHDSTPDARFCYFYAPHQSKVYLSTDETAMLLQRIDRFGNAGQDMDTTTVALHSLHVLWALGFPHHLFPFDPGG